VEEPRPDARTAYSFALAEIRLQLSRFVLKHWADDFGWPLTSREDESAG
jgi:hypothetical protein